MNQHVKVVLVMKRDCRQRVLEQLEACPVEVTPACDWKEAQRILARSSVDVVVAEPDGEWSPTMDSSGRQVQIVICGRRDSGRQCTQLFDRGAYDVLVEPYSCEELLHVLEAAANTTYMHSLRGLAAATLRAAG